MPDLDGLVCESFCEVDIDAVNPNPTASRWSLSVTAVVDERLELSDEDLLATDIDHRSTRCGASANP